MWHVGRKRDTVEWWTRERLLKEKAFKWRPTWWDRFSQESITSQRGAHAQTTDFPFLVWLPRCQSQVWRLRGLSLIQVSPCSEQVAQALLAGFSQSPELVPVGSLPAPQWHLETPKKAHWNSAHCSPRWWWNFGAGSMLTQEIHQRKASRSKITFWEAFCFIFHTNPRVYTWGHTLS